MKTSHDFLNSFPKIRPELPPEYRAIYTQQYQENRGGETTASSLSQKMEAWLHRQVAKDVVGLPEAPSTLEIGAGNLNQLRHEPKCDAYDIIEPFAELYEASPLLSRIRKVYADISDVPTNSRYDRITSIAAFEHICNLPEVVARAGLLLNQGGTLRVSIPSEGTFLWTLGWKMTTGLEFKLKHGLDYGVLMRNEHVNTASEIEAVLRHFFTQVKGRSFGLSKRVSLYQFFECKLPDRTRCTAMLSDLAR
jgi:hypothetical protein